MPSVFACFDAKAKFIFSACFTFIILRAQTFTTTVTDFDVFSLRPDILTNSLMTFISFSKEYFVHYLYILHHQQIMSVIIYCKSL
jgi:hypothetical protein